MRQLGRILGFLVGAAAVMVLVTGCPPRTTGTGIDDIALDVSLPDADGNIHRLSDYLGKVVWLQFLADGSDLTQCRLQAEESMPEIYDHFQGEDLQILAVLSLIQTGVRRANAEDAREWAERYGLAYPVLYDDGSTGAWEAYRFENDTGSFPVNVIIDREGIIRAKAIGYAADDNYYRNIIGYWLRR